MNNPVYCIFFSLGLFIYMNEVYVGIDLGTENSVCYFIRNERIEQVQMSDGTSYCPSTAVYKEKGKATILPSKLLIPTRTKNVVRNYKLIVGKTIDEKTIKEFKKKYNMSLEEREGVTGFRIELGSRNSFIKTPSEVCSDVLRELLKLIGERAGNNDFNTACLTVPAAFNQNQIKALHNILRELNIPNSVIVSEPVAAAVAYGNSVDGQGDGIYLVFDYGGGTFDSAVVKKEGNNYTVLSKGGKNTIGGTAIDSEIANEILYNKVSKNNRRRIQQYYADDRNYSKLLSSVENAKIALSSSHEIEIELDWRDDEDEDDLDTIIVLTRVDIERAIQSYVNQAMDIMMKTITECRKELNEIDHVIMVGGTSQIPYIRQRVLEFFPKEKVHMNVNPMTIVGEGACLIAKWYAEGTKCDKSEDFSYYNEEEEEKRRKNREKADGKHRFVQKDDDRNGNTKVNNLIDCLYEPISIRSGENESFFLFSKCTNYGNQKTIQIETTYDGQNIIYLDFCQGESREFGQNYYLGRLEYIIKDKDENGNLIYYKRGKGVFILTCILDSQGILKCEIQSQQTGKTERMELNVREKEEEEKKNEKKISDQRDSEKVLENESGELEENYQQIMRELRKKRVELVSTDKYSDIVYHMNEVSRKKKEMEKGDLATMRSLVVELNEIKSRYFCGS